MLSIRKFRIIVLILNQIEYWSNYLIWNFEYSRSTTVCIFIYSLQLVNLEN